jgi:sugar lactone lactonase YvrE
MNYVDKRIMRANSLLIIAILLGTFLPSKALEAETILPKVYSANSIAKDQLGNTYVAGVKESKIYKLDNTGKVSVYAGSGTASFKDGSLTEAQFRNPYAVAIDSLGNLFVADSGNNSIRKIHSETGMVSTFAGNINIGDKDGKGAQAEFNFPAGLVIDHNDNLFVSDQRNHRIRKIDKYGKVSTVAGAAESGYQDGAESQALFRYPGALALDPKDNLYILDVGNKQLRRINRDGSVGTITNPKDNGSNLQIPKPAVEVERIAMYNFN